MKQQSLKEYFTRVNHFLTGEKVRISQEALAGDFLAKGEWISTHIRARNGFPIQKAMAGLTATTTMTEDAWKVTILRGYSCP